MFAPQTSIDQLNSSMSSLDSFLLTGTLNVTALAASVDSVAAAIVPPQPATSNTLTALAAAEARSTSHAQRCRHALHAYSQKMVECACLQLHGLTTWSGCDVC